MFQISDKTMRIVKGINIALLVLTIITLLVCYFNKISVLNEKERIEKLRLSALETNKDAYQWARFIIGIGTGLGVGARVLGIYATLRESLLHSLVYGSTLVVILILNIIGIVEMSVFDIVFHVILTVIAFVFARLVGKEEPFSKDVGTLPL